VTSHPSTAQPAGPLGGVRLAAPTELELEFDRQVDALALTGLPALLEIKDECFRAMLEPLRDLLPPPSAVGDGIPFVVVVPHAPVAELLPAVHTPAGEGWTELPPAELARFRPRSELDVPAAPYLLLDVDAGTDNLNVAPAEAERAIAAAGRMPLTVAEGVAVLVSDCGVLRTGDCFALLGSSAGGSLVPVLWTGDTGPTLRAWERLAAHPRLGSASCGGRRTA
jgi:Family of unknown function (DUF5701)